jgi:outer membrane protein assembly factor BamB
MKLSTRTLIMTLAYFFFISAAWAVAQDWPEWRGPSRDNKVTGFAEPKTWPKNLTKKWTVSVGIGEASPVLVGDNLYTFGRQDGDEVTLCLDANTGKEIWKEKYAAAFVAKGDKVYPGPRSTPAVGEGKICTLGVNGLLICRDAATGKQTWQHDKGFPKFHTSTSPIIANGKCIVFAGALTAFDLKTGESKWSWSGNPGYGSPVFMTVDGVKQVVVPSEGVLAGVNFADGKLLWKVNIGTAWQNSYSTPVVNGNIVYYSITPGKGDKGGKGTDGRVATGFLALQIEKKDDTFSANEIWKKNPAAGYHTPVFRDGLIYGVSLKGKHFFCLDGKTGEEKWSDDADHGECGCILNVGSVLVALTSNKNLIVFRPGGKDYSEIARYRVSSSPTWCVPILAGNRIYVKDKEGSLTLWTLE